MVREVSWNVKDYIARDSAANAQKVVRAIEHATNRLVAFPDAFRMIPEFQDPDRRETFVHGRRLLSNVPGSFEESPQEAYTAA